jgi:hydrogenase-4 component B
MEKMGGLIRGMPVTAFCFLIGAAAISGLPPLNGFASEWMLFQSLLSGVKIPHSLIAAVMGLSVGVIALTAGLAAACFVKAFGISFLAIARSDEAQRASEVCGAMRFAMLALASACLLLGLLGPWAVPGVARSIAALPGLDASAVAFSFGATMVNPDRASTISPPYIALLLAAVVAVTPLFLRILKVNRKLRFGESWGCGRSTQSPRMEYTSSAFAEPLRRVFSGLYRPSKDISIDFHPESKYFVQAIKYSHEVRPWFEEYLYEPMGRAVRRLGDVGRVIQSGSVHWYVGYIFIALIAFLILARWI